MTEISTFTGTPKLEVQRDDFGRPLVLQPNGKTKRYSRCTSFIDVLQSRYNLEQWQIRMTMLGLVDRADYRMEVSNIGVPGKDDKHKKQALDAVAAKAREHAAASAAATIGTGLHALTERLDRGEITFDQIPVEYVADLAAYSDATAPFTMLHIERFLVNDRYCVGGTPDRIVRWQGRTYIADVKTGGLEYAAPNIAMQLAMYARSSLYDPATGERSIHGAEIDRAIVIHLPAGAGVCTLEWVDLMQGWEGVLLANDVRGWRNRKRSHLMSPFPAEPIFHPRPLAAPDPLEIAPVEMPSDTAVVLHPDEPATPEPRTEFVPPPHEDELLWHISHALNEAALTHLWTTRHALWTDVHKEAARHRKAFLKGEGPE